MTTAGVPVILYVAVAPGQDPEPHMAACRAFADGYGWHVHAELVDRLDAAGRRRYRATVRQALESGRVRGLLTYARPMLATLSEDWAELADWAAEHGAFVEAVWRPTDAEGQLVYDTATGCVGQLQAVYSPGTAWLRPHPGGGVEWTAHPDQLAPVDLAAVTA